MSSAIIIERIDHTCAHQAQGIAIVIDVIRAFTVAGYAFAGGARAMWLVRTTEEAQALRQQYPDALLAGEVGGRLIPGFDFNNSPSLMAQRDVHGKLLIQRTGAGTQGAVAVAQTAATILLCALTNAKATASYAEQLATTLKQPITLFPTASFTDTSPWNEDVLCADYLEALLREQDNAQGILSQGMQRLRVARLQPWQQGDPDLPSGDIAAVLSPDRFNFAMVGSRKEWQHITYVDVEQHQV